MLINKENLDKAEKAYIDFEQEYYKLWGNMFKSYNPEPAGPKFVKVLEDLFKDEYLQYDDLQYDDSIISAIED